MTGKLQLDGLGDILREMLGMRGQRGLLSMTSKTTRVKGIQVTLDTRDVCWKAHDRFPSSLDRYRVLHDK